MKEKDYETCDLMHGNICVSTPCVCKRFKKPKKEDKAMTKYFRRGTREYYQVTPERCIMIINKFAKSEVVICEASDSLSGESFKFMVKDAVEGKPITREEFAKEFLVASRLIVLEP